MKLSRSVVSCPLAEDGGGGRGEGHFTITIMVVVVVPRLYSYVKLRVKTLIYAVCCSSIIPDKVV